MIRVLYYRCSRQHWGLSYSHWEGGPIVWKTIFGQLIVSSFGWAKEAHGKVLNAKVDGGAILLLLE